MFFYLMIKIWIVQPDGSRDLTILQYPNMHFRTEQQCRDYGGAVVKDMTDLQEPVYIDGNPEADDDAGGTAIYIVCSNGLRIRG